MTRKMAREKLHALYFFRPRLMARGMWTTEHERILEALQNRLWT